MGCTLVSEPSKLGFNGKVAWFRTVSRTFGIPPRAGGAINDYKRVPRHFVTRDTFYFTLYEYSLGAQIRRYYPSIEANYLAYRKLLYELLGVALDLGATSAVWRCDCCCTDGDGRFAICRITNDAAIRAAPSGNATFWITTKVG